MLEHAFESVSDMRSDQAEGLRRLLGRNMARVITLEAGASGAGKTSVAVNIAAALATRGMQVLLLDANSGAANVSALLGLRPRFDLRDALNGRCGLDDTLLHGPAGVMVLPAVSALRDGHSVRERERFDATRGTGLADAITRQLSSGTAPAAAPAADESSALQMSTLALARMNLDATAQAVAPSTLAAADFDVQPISLDD